MSTNRQTSQRARSSTTRLHARIHATVTGAPRKIDTEERKYYRAAAKRRIAPIDPPVIRNSRRGSWDGHDCVAPRAGHNDSASQHNVSDSPRTHFPTQNTTRVQSSAVSPVIVATAANPPQPPACRRTPKFLKGIPGCAFNRTTGAVAEWDEASVSS
jgi:hypothetical protein